MRVKFSEVFVTNSDGSFSPRGSVKIGGVTMASGVSFRPGVALSGIDIAQYADHDLEVEQQADGITVVKRVFAAN